MTPDWRPEAVIRDSGDPASFVCPACDRRSSNPNDIAERYCGACHWWTGDPTKAWQRPDLFEVHSKTPPPAPLR